jgi:hypothetical protein
MNYVIQNTACLLLPFFGLCFIKSGRKPVALALKRTRIRFFGLVFSLPCSTVWLLFPYIGHKRLILLVFGKPDTYFYAPNLQLFLYNRLNRIHFYFVSQCLS